MNSKVAVFRQVFSTCWYFIPRIYSLTISPAKDIVMMCNEPHFWTQHVKLQVHVIDLCGQTLQDLSHISAFNNTSNNNWSSVRQATVSYLIHSTTDILLGLFNSSLGLRVLLRTIILYKYVYIPCSMIPTTPLPSLGSTV